MRVDRLLEDGQAAVYDSSRSIFVGNLPFDVEVGGRVVKRDDTPASQHVSFLVQDLVGTISYLIFPTRIVQAETSYHGRQGQPRILVD